MAVIIAIAAGIMIGGCAMAVLAKARIRELSRDLANAQHEMTYLRNHLDQAYHARQALAAQLRDAGSALQRALGARQSLN